MNTSRSRLDRASLWTKLGKARVSSGARPETPTSLSLSLHPHRFATHNSAPSPSTPHNNHISSKHNTLTQLKSGGHAQLALTSPAHARRLRITLARPAADFALGALSLCSTMPPRAHHHHHGAPSPALSLSGSGNPFPPLGLAAAAAAVAASPSGGGAGSAAAAAAAAQAAAEGLPPAPTKVDTSALAQACRLQDAYWSDDEVSLPAPCMRARAVSRRCRQ